MNLYSGSCGSVPSRWLRPWMQLALPCVLLTGTGRSLQATAQNSASPGIAPPRAASNPVLPLAVHTASAGDALHILVGRSIVLSSAEFLKRVYVGNPAVLQTFTAGSSEIVLTAKAPGVSSMVVWDEEGGSRLYTIFADVDPESLSTSLRQAFPAAAIHAEAGEGKVFLSGSASTEAVSEAAVKMASLYAKEVVNSIRVMPLHGKQVELKLRIVEVDRTKLEQLGINIFAGGRTSVQTTTGQYLSNLASTNSSLTVSNPLDIFLYNAKLNVGLTIQDLEQKQVLQVLAEPTLTTLSGLPARFLSGGEFPFPVVEGGTGGSTAISIQFRPYGVKVEFTPTVNADGSIRLKLSPEVSTLDYTNAVTISGFTIPALSTRRSETEVEIQDGQSFMVSGLLDRRTTEIMSKVPGIGDVPILGQLFRSKNFNHSLEELVIIVTANIVNPLVNATNPLADTKQGPSGEATPGLSSDAKPNPPREPRFVVPNLEADSFDRSAQRQAGGSAADNPADTQSPPAAQNKPEPQ